MSAMLKIRERLKSRQHEPQALEHEVKFVFLNHHVRPILEWLRHSCRLDPEYAHNIVASIYYDTREWRFLQDKINSDYLKTKVRVRWYRTPGASEPQGKAFIEVKSKIGAPRTKFRMEAPFPAKWFYQVPLEDSRLLEIPQRLRVQGVLTERRPLFPAFIVQYERYRFVEPISQTRVCIDCNIHAPKVNRTMVPALQSGILHSAVLEVKGDVDGLPGVLSKLLLFGAKKSSFSKYLACYQKLHHIEFH